MKSELSDFLPYLLNQAAELVSQEFQPCYKDKYGMLRTEWRVLFHLGRVGEMTAKQICNQAALHKTKVSRAVVALEQKRFVKREKAAEDRRFERLTLTKSGQAAFKDLSRAASRYDQSIEQVLGGADTAALKRILAKVITETSANER